jgi:hypothetical protein
MNGWVCNGIKSLFPSSRLAYKRQLISGEDYECSIDKLPGGKDKDIAFWELKQFCLKGWEPFKVAAVFPFNTDSSVYLRLKN